MNENRFQAKLIEELKLIFPGCIVLKNDPNYIQGFPDLTVLYGQLWAVLECKKSQYEQYRPNQEFYLEVCNKMGFSATIYPENKDDVLFHLKRYFEGS